MPLYGTLTSMPLPDLLQWLCNARVTGTLRVELDRVSKSIHLVEGMITGCSSDDPAQRIGHFLLSRGQITEEQLREALQLQEISGQHLGTLLVELGALTAENLSSNLEAQAEETIHSLFDWDDAVFKFQEAENGRTAAFPVNLRVEDVLLRGLKRYDEMRQIREVFDDPGIVLERTDKAPPTAVLENRMGHALWELIDGERTVAEILLQVHGSEYVVTKFLYELHRSSLVRVARVKEIPRPRPNFDLPDGRATGRQPDSKPPAEFGAEPAGAATAEAPPEPTSNRRPMPGPGESGRQAMPETAPASAALVAEPAADQGALPDQGALAERAAGAESRLPQTGADESDQDKFEDLLAEFNPNMDLPAGKAETAVAAGADPAAGAAETAAEEARGDADDFSEAAAAAVEESGPRALEQNLERARRLMSKSEFEQALLILEELYREQPGEESLRRLTAEAEAAFVEKAYRHFLPPSKVLHLTREMDGLQTEDLSPSEFFLLSRIDGTWDIKSIIQIAPLRESDALRTLKRLRENGLIELKDP